MCSQKSGTDKFDGDPAVPPEALTKVFKGKPLPFGTNSDGSVDMLVYQAWLNETGRLALQEFEDHFVVVGNPGQSGESRCHDALQCFMQATEQYRLALQNREIGLGDVEKERGDAWYREGYRHLARMGLT